MRTTIKIDDRVLAEAKVHAARSGKTLNAVVEDARRSRAPACVRASTWTTARPCST
jgi:hypothetical protein